ncbi:hypothetical protein FKM82_008944 [Ascaphus truei]
MTQPLRHFLPWLVISGPQRKVLWELVMAHGGGAGGTPSPESLLLHPELLSRDFLLLSLVQKNILVEETSNDKDKLTDIFVQHAMPLPQRDLPVSRWGRTMESKRGETKTAVVQNKSGGAENLRKRPLIVFDGSSTSTSIKVKKKENGETAERLRPSLTESKNSTHQRLAGPPANPAPHLCPSASIRDVHDISAPVTDGAEFSEKSLQPGTGSAGTTIVKIKRAAPKDESDEANDVKPTEAKKKIQHVTWP